MLKRLAIAAAVLAASAASAQQAGQREELTRVEGEQQAREAQQRATLAEAEQTRREIAELNAQLSELSAAQARGETEVDGKRLRLAALTAREAELTARAGANQTQLSHLLGALQMFSRDPPPALLLHPRDARKAVRAAILLKATAPELERRAHAFAAQSRDARRVRRDAAAGAEDLFASESGLAERAARIETLLVEKTVLEQGLTREAVIAARQIEALAVRAQALRALVGRLPPPPARAVAVKLAPRSLTAPLPGPPARRFGQAQPSGGKSEGWTWTPAAGAAISAPAGALVAYSGPIEGWRNVVILDLGAGAHVVVAGIDMPSVVQGQSVAAGQTIGRMAENSPSRLGSTPPELHLEVRKDGKPVDPALFMTGR